MSSAGQCRTQASSGRFITTIYRLGTSFSRDSAIVADGCGLFDQHHTEFELGECVFPGERRHYHRDVAARERAAELAGLHALRAAASHVGRPISRSVFPFGSQSGGRSDGDSDQCEHVGPDKLQRAGAAARDGGDDAAAAGDAGEAVDLLSGMHQDVLSEGFAVQSASESLDLRVGYHRSLRRHH